MSVVKGSIKFFYFVQCFAILGTSYGARVPDLSFREQRLVEKMDAYNPPSKDKENASLETRIVGGDDASSGEYPVCCSNSSLTKIIGLSGLDGSVMTTLISISSCSSRDLKYAGSESDVFTGRVPQNDGVYYAWSHYLKPRVGRQPV